MTATWTPIHRFKDTYVHGVDHPDDLASYQIADNGRELGQVRRDYLYDADHTRAWFVASNDPDRPTVYAPSPVRAARAAGLPLPEAA